MREAERIADQLRRAYEGDAWHGPALAELLDGLTAEQAARRPLAGAHTIWELVLHITAWTGVVRRRLQGEAVNVPEVGDWPPVSRVEGQEWDDALARLRQAHLSIVKAVSELPDARLEEPVPGQDYSVYTMLHGLVQHDLYHAGQVALLKKAP